MPRAPVVDGTVPIAAAKVSNLPCSSVQLRYSAQQTVFSVVGAVVQYSLSGVSRCRDARLLIVDGMLQSRES